MKKSIISVGLLAVLGACGQSTETGTANQAAANQVQPKKKPAYCFFKEPETKAWAATRGKDGNITVKGKVFRSDSRYKAVLQPPVVTGTSAEISPSIVLNDTGYGAPGNWWDVSAILPNSAAIDTVDVTCGARKLAEFKLPPKS